MPVGEKTTQANEGQEIGARKTCDLRPNLSRQSLSKIEIHDRERVLRHRTLLP